MTQICYIINILVVILQINWVTPCPLKTPKKDEPYFEWLSERKGAIRSVSLQRGTIPNSASWVSSSSRAMSELFPDIGVSSRFKICCPVIDYFTEAVHSLSLLLSTWRCIGWYRQSQKKHSASNITSSADCFHYRAVISTLRGKGRFRDVIPRWL